MIQRIVKLTLLYCCLSASIQAQAPSRAPASSSNVNLKPPPGVAMDSNTLPLMSDKAFNTDSDSIDFEEGILNWKGRTFNLGNNRAIRARFERYLASPSNDDEDEAYSKLMQDIQQKLSQLDTQQAAKNSEAMQKDVFAAWKLLFEAGQYRLDNGSSLLVANLVNNAWRMRNERQQSIDAEKVLLAEKQKLQDRILQDNFWQEKKFNDIQVAQARGQHTGAAYSSITRATYHTQELTEVQTRIGALNVQTAANATQLKLQYQSQMVQFLTQRRYQHTLIAATFYRHIFKSSHQGLQVGKAQLEEILPDSDLQPTVDALEFIAREAMNDVEIGMQTVENLYVNEELHGALQRLQETFFLGEYMPSVIQYESEKKRKILELFRHTRDLQKFMDFKDYTQANQSLDDIRKLADDFPASSFSSLINAAMRASNLAVLKAKQATAAEQFDKAETALQQATEMWPLNPAIKTFSENLTEHTDIVAQGSKVFDELFSAAEFRRIFEKRAEFSAALLTDPNRSEQLKLAVDKIANIDFLLAKVKAALNQNEPYAAWEYLLQAESIHTNDLELQKAKANVSIKAQPFAQYLQNALNEESSGALPIALIRYQEAQRTFPASTICHERIKVIASKILDDQASKAAIKQ